MEKQKIKVDELKLSNIVNDFSEGKIRIPRFQRNYVWDRPRVIKLLNSIYREYPIGTFFFWEAAFEYIHLYRNVPELNIPELIDNSSFHFILDGQQRITSLYAAIKGLSLTIYDSKGNPRIIDYSSISFDLDKEEFINKNPDNIRFVALSSILEENHMTLFKSLTDDRSNTFNKCYLRFSSYPLSVVYVKDQSLSEACVIFERINQGGIKLSLFDLVVASTWSNEFDLKLEVNKLNDYFKEKGFGSLQPETILQTISLLVKGQATRPSELSLKKDEIINEWDIVVKALQLSIDYISANLGVKIIEFIPYVSIIPIIAYLFAKSGNRSLSNEQREFIDEWFWKCTFSQHYNSSTASLMGEDRRNLIDPLLKGEKVAIDYPISINAKDLQLTTMYRYSALRNGVLCILAQLNPKHFKNGANFELNRNTLSDYNEPERHHIFPRAFLRGIKHEWSENSIVNFCFIPAELNNEIKKKPPTQYFSNFKKINPYFKESLESHLIISDEKSAIWNDDYSQFLAQRSDLLLNEIEKRIGRISLLEDQLKNEPDLVISKIEENLRIMIDAILTQKYGTEYWNQAIPGDVQENVKQRIKQNSERYPDREVQTDFDKLKFFDFSDYHKIISSKKHWGLFEDIFASQGDFDRNFIFLRDYRNGIKHIQEMTPLAQKYGEAAAEWFNIRMKEFKKEDIESEEE